MKNNNKPPLILLLIMFVSIPCCTIAGEEATRNDATVDSVFLFHLNFVKKCSEDTGFHYSQAEISNHLEFLEAVTRIGSRATRSESLQFYRGLEPAKQDYQNWSDWYRDNKNMLEWDPLHKLIEIKDPNRQTCDALSPDDRGIRMMKEWGGIGIYYCTTWGADSPCSLCLDSDTGKARAMSSPPDMTSGGATEESPQDSIAGSDIHEVEIDNFDNQQEVVDFTKVLDACRLSPRFEFKYICPRIVCTISGTTSGHYEISFSNTGLMMLDGCVYDTDPRMLDLLAKYLPPDYFCPGK